MIPPLIIAGIAGATTIGLIHKHRQNNQNTDIQKWANSLGVHDEITPDTCLPDGTPLLIMAIRTYDIHAVKALLEMGFSPDVRDSKGTPALFYVVRNKFAKDLLPTFIKYHANLNIMNRNGETALFLSKSSHILTRLCHNGAIANAQNIDGKTPLHLATNPEITKTLLICGANPNIQDKTGKTPLHYASSSDITEILLNYDANPNIQDNSGKSPLHTSHYQTQVEQLLKKGANPNIIDNEGKTPLFYMINPLSAKALIDAGADQTIRDNNGYLAPILDGLPDILLKYSRKPHNDNLNENLYWAVIYDNPKRVIELIVQGANPDAPGLNRESLLNSAKSKQMLTTLCQWGVDPNNRFNMTSPLNHWLERNNAKFCEILLKFGAEPTSHALQIAINHNSLSCCQLLLEAGCSVTKKNWISAKQSKQLDILCLLKKYSAYD